MYEITISCVDLQDEDLAVDHFHLHVGRVIDFRDRSKLEGSRQNLDDLLGQQLPFCCLCHGPTEQPS